MVPNNTIIFIKYKVRFLIIKGTRTNSLWYLTNADRDSLSQCPHMCKPGDLYPHRHKQIFSGHVSVTPAKGTSQKLEFQKGYFSCPLKNDIVLDEEDLVNKFKVSLYVYCKFSYYCYKNKIIPSWGSVVCAFCI